MFLREESPMDGPLYAGFWRRFAAYIVDGAILLLPSFLVGFLVGMAGLDPFFSYGVSILVAWLYYAFFHASALQATPGKSAFGVKVTDLAGARIAFRRATGRYFATWLSTLSVFIGYLLAAWTPKRQALHDILARTLVVRKDASPAQVQAGGSVMPVTPGVWITVVVLFVLPAGIFTAVGIPAYGDYLVRAKVADVLAHGTVAKPAAEAMILEKRLPSEGSTLALVVASPHLAVLAIDHRGRIVMSLKDVPQAPNGRIYMTPQVEYGGAVRWSCSAEGVEDRYLPASCRRSN
jgi:uncharacterized RDD family membrane protein YckC